MRIMMFVVVLVLLSVVAYASQDDVKDVVRAQELRIKELRADTGFSLIEWFKGLVGMSKVDQANDIIASQEYDTSRVVLVDVDGAQVVVTRTRTYEVDGEKEWCFENDDARMIVCKSTLRCDGSQRQPVAPSVGCLWRSVPYGDGSVLSWQYHGDSDGGIDVIKEDLVAREVTP